MANIRLNWLTVLIPFTHDYNVKYTASEIARITNIPQRTVARILDDVARQSLIRFILDGKNKKFYFDLNDFRVKLLIKLIEDYKTLTFSMMNKKVYVMIEDLIKQRDIIIFGSYAKNTFNEKSDIDILVIGRKSKKLTKLAKIQPKSINLHFSTITEFEKLLKQKNTLAIEIMNNHIIFGSIFFDLCWRYYINEI